MLCFVFNVGFSIFFLYLIISVIKNFVFVLKKKKSLLFITIITILCRYHNLYHLYTSINSYHMQHVTNIMKTMWLDNIILRYGVGTYTYERLLVSSDRTM